MDSWRILCVSIIPVHIPTLHPLTVENSTSTSFQLLYGRLSDIWSRKVILLIGFAIFFFGSLAASLAGNVMQLIAFRAITGVVVCDRIQILRKPMLTEDQCMFSQDIESRN
jgi:hypothetical protein